MKHLPMRSAMAMIELIFAIVIIAIALLSIPSMLAIANNASKVSIIDEDIMSRLSGWTIDKSQARWDANYRASGSPILWSNEGELGCIENRDGGWYRDNNASGIPCDELARTPSAPILSPFADGNLSKGIERLNGGTETITVTAATGETYTVDATYAVRYVASTVVVNNNTATATWTLGSSDSMSPDGSTATVTHLKRVVSRFQNDDLDVDTTLTFFKSNKGN